MKLLFNLESDEKSLCSFKDVTQILKSILNG